MKYLLDTCLLSELVKPLPDRGVVKWVQSCSEYDFAVSVLTLGEIYRGIIRLGEGQKKEKLISWLNEDLMDRFQDRILSIDYEVSHAWSEIDHLRHKSGRPLKDDVDALIAATAKVHRLSVVTRNESDFSDLGVKVINPWKS